MLTRLTLAPIAWAALGFAIGTSGYAIAQSTLMKTAAQPSLGTLSNNEGLYIDRTTFDIRQGAAKEDPAAHLAKMGAKEISHGLFVFRSGDTLYVVDGKPGDTPQAMRNFDDI